MTTILNITATGDWQSVEMLKCTRAFSIQSRDNVHDVLLKLDEDDAYWTIKAGTTVGTKGYKRYTAMYVKADEDTEIEVALGG